MYRKLKNNQLTRTRTVTSQNSQTESRSFSISSVCCFTLEENWVTKMFCILLGTTQIRSDQCRKRKENQRKKEEKNAAKLFWVKTNVLKLSLTMNTVQVYVFAWLIVTLPDFLILTIGSRHTGVIRSGDGDYFANPDKNCYSRSCYSYNSKIVGGSCATLERSCCTRCRCPYHARTYIVQARPCMSLDEIRQYEVIQTTNGKCLKFVFTL